VQLIVAVHGLLSAMLQMKSTVLLVALAICIVCAMSASGCSPPLNCTGVYHCPLIESGPGVVVESGAKYCSCCPVSITYLGTFHVPSASCSLAHATLHPPWIPNSTFFQVGFFSPTPKLKPMGPIGGTAPRRTCDRRLQYKLERALLHCKYGPVLSSERAPHINKPATV
jgi:hypothetical protein